MYESLETLLDVDRATSSTRIEAIQTLPYEDYDTCQLATREGIRSSVSLLLACNWVESTNLNTRVNYLLCKRMSPPVVSGHGSRPRGLDRRPRRPLEQQEHTPYLVQ